MYIYANLCSRVRWPYKRNSQTLFNYVQTCKRSDNLFVTHPPGNVKLAGNRSSNIHIRISN